LTKNTRKFDKLGDLVYVHSNLRLLENIQTVNCVETRMWANAQGDGRHGKRRWRPLFNAANFGWRSLLDCRAV